MIYADNAATTRISDNAFNGMQPYLCEQYGNASSQYSFGLKAKRAVEYARSQVATAIGAKPSEIIFASSGSEVNSWVLRGIVETFKGQAIHIVTSSFEHPSVLNTCRMLEKNGIDITYLPIDSLGHISIDDVKNVIRSNTKLISIMFVNNEIGTIQPIAKIGQWLRTKEILFHTDAVQAVGHIPVNVNDLQIDFLTASAHKFNGAKGTGILFKRSGLALPTLIFGGKQEQGFRAGTENVAGIVAAGYALEENVSEMTEIAKRLKDMVETTVTEISQKIPNVQINSDKENGLPGIVNLGFEGVAGESLMHLLDLKGICVSTSSACASGNDEPSHVLIALGQSYEQAKSAIRISYGKYNTIREVNTVISAICDVYGKIKASRG